MNRKGSMHVQVKPNYIPEQNTVYKNRRVFKIMIQSVPFA